MWDWLANANSNHVTVAVGCIAVVATFAAAHYALVPHFATKRRERILDTRSWDEMITALRPDWADRYFGAIGETTGIFDRIYGPKPLGWRAYDRALDFALIYAILSLLIGWVLFDAGNLGGMAFLPEGLPPWHRVLTMAAIFGSSATILILLSSRTAIKAWLIIQFEANFAIFVWLRRFMFLPRSFLSKLVFSFLFSASIGAAILGSANGAIFITGAGATVVLVAIASILLGAVISNKFNSDYRRFTPSGVSIGIGVSVGALIIANFTINNPSYLENNLRNV